MRKSEIVRALPVGLLTLAMGVGIALGVRWIGGRKNQPNRVPPPAGRTLTGDAARQLHPRTGQVELDAH